MGVWSSVGIISILRFNSIQNLQLRSRLVAVEDSFFPLCHNEASVCIFFDACLGIRAVNE